MSKNPKGLSLLRKYNLTWRLGLLHQNLIGEEKRKFYKCEDQVSFNKTGDEGQVFNITFRYQISHQDKRI